MHGTRFTTSKGAANDAQRVRVPACVMPMHKKRERIVSMKIDAAHPPPLTRKQKAELVALAKMPDSQIDYSDIPQTPAGFWEKPISGRR